jgi:hypothetical protein
MKKKICFIFILFVCYSSFASNFVIRHVDSKSADFKRALESAEKISYVDHLIFLAKNREYKIENIDQAVEASFVDPKKSLEHYRNAIQKINSELINSDGIELLGHIYFRVFKLKIANPLKEIYKQRLLDLIEFEPKLLSNPDFKNYKNLFYKKKYSSKVFKQKEVNIFLKQWKKSKSLEDAVFFVNGRQQKVTSGWLPPEGTHQWAFLSNTYLPIITHGTWNEFFTEFNKTSNFQPLILGSCENIYLDSDSFNLQTNADLYFSDKCTPLQSPNKNLAHLTSKIDAKINRKNMWSTIILFAAAGLIYSELHDKNVKIKIPF